MNEIEKYKIVPAAETIRLLEAYVSIFVIPAEAGVQLFRSGPLLL